MQRRSGKMGKSLKNAVPVEEMYDAYGSDTLRLHLMATGPLDASRPWETRDVVGMYRFLQRLWRNVVSEATGEVSVADAAPAAETNRLLHRTIDVVRSEVEGLRFNTAIAKLIELNNHLTKLAASGPIRREAAEALVLMVAPFAPHIGEELWLRLGHDGGITYAPFPVADPALLVDDTIEYPVQVNGKVRGHVTVAADADQATVEAAALADAQRRSRRWAGRRRRRSSSCPAGWSTSSSDGGRQTRRSASRSRPRPARRSSELSARARRRRHPRGSSPRAVRRRRRTPGSSSTRRTAAAIAAGSGRPLQRDAGPARRDPPGVVGLVAAVGQHDERHAGGEGAHDRAVTAVGDDRRGVRAGPPSAARPARRHVRRGASIVAGSMAGPVVTIARTGSVARASTMRCRQATLVLERRREGDEHERPSPVGGRPRLDAAHAGSSRTAPT